MSRISKVFNFDELYSQKPQIDHRRYDKFVSMAFDTAEENSAKIRR